jgi:hypothetical protein
VGSSLQLDNSSEAVKTDITHNMRSNSNIATLIKQGSNEGSNNNDMGSTTKNTFTNCLAPTKEKVCLLGQLVSLHLIDTSRSASI